MTIAVVCDPRAATQSKRRSTSRERSYTPEDLLCGWRHESEGFNLPSERAHRFAGQVGRIGEFVQDFSKRLAVSNGPGVLLLEVTERLRPFRSP